MRKVMHMVRGLLLLILFALVAGAAYMYLAPMMRTEEALVYDAYTVRRGSLMTEKSFSATISVGASETHQNTSRATAIREIYVTNGQSVRKGDKLMLLDNGELLKAGLDGVVTEMRFDTTDWLWNNVDLIKIGDLTHLKVSLSVDEYDVRNVSAGQKCFVTIVPTGEVYETEISHVDRVSASSGQVAYYTASAEITVTDSVLPGMTASVTIPSDSAEDVLVLDMAALAFDEKKQPYVLRRTDLGYEKVPVTTGLTDGMQAEIVSGLNEGDIVWVVSGNETVQERFSLLDLYKKYAGEKVVINDMTGGGQNGRGGFPAMQMPDRNTEMPRVPGAPGLDGQNGEEQVPTFEFAAPTGRQEMMQPPADTVESDEPAADDGTMQVPVPSGEERKETP